MRQSFVYLCLGDKSFSAAHVGTKHLGDSHASVRLKMILKEGNEHTRRSDNGIVQRVRKIYLAVRALYTHSQPASLCIAEV